MGTRAEERLFSLELREENWFSWGILKERRFGLAKSSEPQNTSSLRHTGILVSVLVAGSPFKCCSTSAFVRYLRGFWTISSYSGILDMRILK
jgi:hypothetical protein